MFKPLMLFAFFLLLFQGEIVFAQPGKMDPNLKLWYNQPASIWEEALPLGNAHTGAMVFGRVKKERIQLNDATLWSGHPNPGNNANGPDVLPKVRQAVFKGNYAEADALWKKMQGPYSARYLTMGDLYLDFAHADTVPTSYYRDLDLNNALSTVRYKVGGVTYHREAFTSFPDKVLVMRLTADKRKSLTFTTQLQSKLNHTTTAVAGNALVLKGKAPKYVAHRDYEPQQIVYDEGPKGEGMTFEIHVTVKAEGGTVRKSGNNLTVTGADAVTLYLSEGTSFNGFDKSPGLHGKDPGAEVAANLKQALQKTYAQLKQAHIADFQHLFQRVSLSLGADREALKLPTDERMLRFGTGKSDNQLQALYYQFGRYLLIASSRPGSPATNLQGIWNQHVQPPWGSNYTININTQMNYWLAENTNLSECHIPLFDFIGNLAQNGAQTAKVNYGIQEGWVAHHNTDLWAKTSPTGGYEWDPKGAPRWSCWPMGGAWLSLHLYDHFLYTGDRQFLQAKAYPLLKGAAQFMLHWLVEDKDGYLVTNPSTSPENVFQLGGKDLQISMATTMDIAIIRELFTNCIQTSEVLDIDPAFRAQLVKAKSQLYPYHIGQHGQLQEWFQDWDNPQDSHRHLSHLFGLHPGNHISVTHTPELAAAAKQSLLHRGDVSTGWSMAWKINWWARLQDGNHAFKILRDGLTYIGPKNQEQKGGGTYPNLFDAHPPFQIDGNFGGTAGITEMLLQSHTGEVSLLPALPDEWASGSVSGIKARGNFEVAMDWQNKALVKASITSGSGGNCRLRTLVPVQVVEVPTKQAAGPNPNPLTRIPDKPDFQKSQKANLIQLDTTRGYVVDFATEKGRTYTIRPL